MPMNGLGVIRMALRELFALDGVHLTLREKLIEVVLSIQSVHLRASDGDGLLINWRVHRHGVCRLSSP